MHFIIPKKEQDPASIKRGIYQFLDKHVKSVKKACAVVYVYIVLVNWKLVKNATMHPVLFFRYYNQKSITLAMLT